MMVSTCPTTDRLRAFSLGELSEEISDELIDHLRDCETCQQKLSAADAIVDTLVGRLQDDTDEDPFVKEDACRLAVSKALGALGDAQFSSPGPDESLAAMLPDVIGEYEIVRPIGRGGMSSVFLACHTKLGREVAVKVLASHRLNDPGMLQRFEAEMRMVGGLNHSNIVTAHDAREVDGLPVLVTEFIDGFDVGEIVRRLGPLSVADACSIGDAVCQALKYVDERGMVHRDIKPSNIMLNRDGEVKVLDLGLARLQQADSDQPEMTATGQTMGTADYIAPEQVNDSRDVSIQADVYSLGCTLFKMLAGRAPFADEQHFTAFARLNAHVSEAPPWLADVTDNAPTVVVKLVDSMLRKDPLARPTDLTKLAEDLRRHSSSGNLQQLVESADAVEPGAEPIMSRPATRVRQPSIWKRRLPWLTGIGGALLGCLVAWGIIITVTKSNGESVSFSLPADSHTQIDSDGNAIVNVVGGKGQATGGNEGTPISTPEPTLDGVWRAISVAELEPGSASTSANVIVFFENYFYMFKDNHLRSHGKFVIDSIGSFARTMKFRNLTLTAKESPAVAGSFHFPTQHRQAEFRYDTATGPQVWTVERIVIPDAKEAATPEGRRAFLKLMQSPETKLHLKAINLFSQVRGGLVLPDISTSMSASRRAAHSRASKNNIRKITLAFHNFANDSRNRFPGSANLKPKSGSHPYSWRIAILAHMGDAEKELYKQYNFSEAWDSEHNLKLLTKMPDCFRHPAAPRETTFTSYVGITGPNTLSTVGHKEGVRMRDILDGTANTLLLLESKTEIPWTKPEDIVIENTDGELDAEIASQKCVPYNSTLNYSMADGSVSELEVSKGESVWQDFLKLVARNDSVQPKSDTP